MSSTAADDRKEQRISYRRWRREIHVARMRGSSMVCQQWQDCRRGLNGLGNLSHLAVELKTEARSKSAKVQALHGKSDGPEMRSEKNLASYASFWVLNNRQFNPLSLLERRSGWAEVFRQFR